MDVAALAVPIVAVALIVFIIGEILKRVYSIPTWNLLCGEMKLFCCPPPTH